MFKRTEIIRTAVLCCFTCGLIFQTATARKHRKYAMNYMEQNQDYEPTDKSYDEEGMEEEEELDEYYEEEEELTEEEQVTEEDQQQKSNNAGSFRCKLLKSVRVQITSI